MSADGGDTDGDQGGVGSALREAGGSVAAAPKQRDTGATLLNGIFYGGAAWLIGYLWVYVQLLNDSEIQQQITAQFIERNEFVGEDQAADAIDLFVPSLWQYAGWIYHYSKGGSIGMSINLLPGSYSLDQALLYPYVTERAATLRTTVLTEPWELADPDTARQFVIENPNGFQEFTLVTIAPTALFFAGLVLAYRHGEPSPVDGAIAGAKVTAGFLLLSVVGVFIFTAAASGFTFSAEAGTETSVGASLGLSEFAEGEVSVSGSSGVGAEISPTIELGPSLGRALLTGFVYPMVFGTLGGGVAGTLGRVGVVNRLSDALG